MNSAFFIPTMSSTLPGLRDCDFDIADTRVKLLTHFSVSSVRSSGSLAWHNTCLNRIPIVLTSFAIISGLQGLDHDIIISQDSTLSAASIMGGVATRLRKDC